MDRLIWIAWRAFWVGLGASVVLIGQSVLTPHALPVERADPIVAPSVAPSPPLTEPALSRGPRNVVSKKPRA
jgi:hypothetical protein